MHGEDLRRHRRKGRAGKNVCVLLLGHDGGWARLGQGVELVSLWRGRVACAAVGQSGGGGSC
jgi:hypothetical protein